MTTEAYRGSLPEGVLDHLTAAMSIENRLGTSEDARVGAGPRVTWVPSPKASRKYSGTAQQRPDAHIKHVHDVAPLFEVHLWAPSYLEAEQLEVALEKALYDVFSPNAYELGPEGTQEGEVSPGRRDFLFVVPVRLLRVPLPVATFTPTRLSTATAPSTLADPQGGTPTAGPAAGTTIP